ncbi:MAG: hypothetical protein RIQ94_2156 [Pseudomonadota bacterium]|jgi:hypothetical protein
MSSEEKLRDEIIAFEVAKQQLARWKLIGLGALAAIGLGLDNSFKQSMPIVLGLIPLFVAHCDLINSEYEIRIALIATFFRTHDGFFQSYEEFYVTNDQVNQTKWCDIVKGVNIIPSIVACVITFSIGLCMIFIPTLVTPSKDFYELKLTAFILMASALIGFCLTLKINCHLSAKKDEIYLII